MAGTAVEEVRIQPAASLKTRLRFSIVGLVTVVVIALSLLYLHDVIESGFEDVEQRGVGVGRQVKDLLVERLQEQMSRSELRPATVEESKEVWARMIEQDEWLTRLLPRMILSSRSVVEILISDQQNRTLAGSNPSRVGQTVDWMPSLSSWHDKSLSKRVYELIYSQQDYAIEVPVGVVGSQEPIFNVRVLLSPVLLREAVLTQARNLAAASLVALLLSMLVAAIFADIILQPLARLGKRIDQINAGDAAIDVLPKRGREPKEFADVESKLNMLGQRYRGAREDALQLRSNIEQLLHRLEEAVLLFDGDTRLLMAGGTAERFVERPAGLLAGHTLAELLPPTSAVGAAVHDAVRLRQPLRDFQAVLGRRNAAPVRVLINVELLNQEGSDRSAILVTLRDAESRNQLESQLNISNRLSAINRLTRGVAHEIKNPLNAISLHLELLRPKLADLPGGVTPELSIIGGEIRRLDRVVKTFLDFTRPIKLDLKDTDLAAITAEVATLLKPQASMRNVAITVKGNDGCMMVCDPDLLKQAVLNVVLNGVESMPGGGPLEIETRRSYDEYILTVTDHGTGIPLEHQDRIFDLYFSTKGSGSGIGLAMTFRVVQLHNGTIDFESQPGIGTTFRIRFPAVEQRTRDSG